MLNHSLPIFLLLIGVGVGIAVGIVLPLFLFLFLFTAVRKNNSIPIPIATPTPMKENRGKMPVIPQMSNFPSPPVDLGDYLFIYSLNLITFL